MSILLSDFNKELARRFCITYQEAGYSDDDAGNWVTGFDDAAEAAEAFGEKYDLDPIDGMTEEAALKILQDITDH